VVRALPRHPRGHQQAAALPALATASTVEDQTEDQRDPAAHLHPHPGRWCATHLHLLMAVLLQALLPASDAEGLVRIDDEHRRGCRPACSGSTDGR
jgi:hypothetical protein